MSYELDTSLPTQVVFEHTYNELSAIAHRIRFSVDLVESMLNNENVKVSSIQTVYPHIQGHLMTLDRLVEYMKLYVDFYKSSSHE